MIENIPIKHNLENCNLARTPIDPQQNLNTHEDSMEIAKGLYQEMLGSVMYLYVGTRADISFSASSVSI